MAALYTQEGVTPAPQPLTLQGGTWAYYLYDGPELGLVLQRSGTTVKIQQRFVSAGVDGALAGRFWVTGASAQSLALLTDHQGTTLAALNPNGTQAAGYLYKPLSAFGASDNPSASPSGSVAASSTGFTGASTPNATGGMVYLRDRWYDPQTGRFLTQDPLGLGGGANLYAYAGNNPISFSDPFGDSVFTDDAGAKKAYEEGVASMVSCAIGANCDREQAIAAAEGVNALSAAEADPNIKIHLATGTNTNGLPNQPSGPKLGSLEITDRLDATKLNGQYTLAGVAVHEVVEAYVHFKAAGPYNTATWGPTQDRAHDFAVAHAEDPVYWATGLNSRTSRSPNCNRNAPNGPVRFVDPVVCGLEP